MDRTGAEVLEGISADVPRDRQAADAESDFHRSHQGYRRADAGRCDQPGGDRPDRTRERSRS